MDYRKLISFGKGGYVISVPKGWIEKNNLQKGSIITIEQKDNAVLLSPPRQRLTKSPETRLSIQVDGLSASQVLAKLTTAYLNSTTLITLSGEELHHLLPEVKDHVRKSIALEIIDSEKSKLVIKDYLNFSDVSLPSTFRKIDMTIRSILSDLSQDYDSSNLSRRLHEIDRHFLLLLKSVKRAVNDPSLLRTFSVSFTDLFTYWDYALTLKYVGDALARVITLTDELKLTKSQQEEFQKLVSGVEQYYLRAIKGVLKPTQITDHELNAQPHIVSSSKELNAVAETLRPIYQLCETLLWRVS